MSELDAIGFVPPALLVTVTNLIGVPDDVSNGSSYLEDDGEFMPELSSEDAQILGLIVSTVVPIIFTIIAFVGFIGNLLVVLTVAFNVQMRNTTNILIFNLSLADLLFVIFCIPFTAVDYTLDRWPFGEIWCQCVQYLIFVTAYISIYTLVLMSFDRFLAVCFPVSRIRSERNTSIAIILFWVGVLVYNYPAYLAHGTTVQTTVENGQNTTFAKCHFIKDNEFISWSTFHISMFICSYLVPLILISGLYLVMLVRLWKSNLNQSRESRRGKRRVTRLVIIVVVCFATLWLPIQTILLLKSLDMYEASSLFTISLQIFGQVLAYISSCINPFLYAFLSENFRKSFRKVSLSRKINICIAHINFIIPI